MALGPNGLILIIVATALVSLATLVVLIRLYARFVLARDPGIDDWCIIAATILTIGTLVSIDLGVSYGTGLRQRENSVDTATLEKIRLSTQLLYTISSGLIKLSICFLYRRLFPALHICVIVTVVFICGMTIAFFFTAIFQCEPVGGIWSFGNPDTSHCIDVSIFWCDVAVIYLLTDLWLVIMPMRTIYHLHASWKKKTAVIALLSSTGLIAGIAASIRLAFVIHLYKGRDPSWDSVPVYYCSVVELTTAMVASSIPPIRLIWRKRSRKGGVQVQTSHGRGSSLSSV
ncbi:hypothetical protein BJX64DRAFT_39754 [Aspergillus heterothallicus]